MKRRTRGALLSAAALLAVVLGTRASLSTPEAPPPRDALAQIPREKGLPVIVRVALQYLEITGLDENEGAFAGTVDLRLRWADPRLAYPAAETPAGFKELRGEAVAARLGEIWHPDVSLANLAEDAKEGPQQLRLFPDGWLELMRRVHGRFRFPLDVERFPFDQQRLEVQVLCAADGIEEVALESRREDLEWSNERVGLKLDDWDPGVVDVRADRMPGWHGDSHARLRVHLPVRRRPGASVGPIFIPLFASLLIPLLALWLNRIEDGAFQIEAFELTNVIVGGLFAVIALNFTINAEYKALAGSRNAVTALFALNYITLAVSLVANIALFRFNVVKRLWGSHVQQEVYQYLVWAVPLLAGATAAAFLLAARA